MATAVLTDRRARLQTSPLRHLDAALVGATLAIAGLGLLMVYSSTRARTAAAGVSSLHFVQRQAVAVVLGLVVMVAVMAVDYRKLRDAAVLVYGSTALLLVAVLSPLGSTAKGTQGWFQLPGGFQLQPSELAKFGLVVGLAAYCHHHRGELDVRRFVVAVGVAAAPMALVMLQPDLGTAMVLGVIAIGVLTVAGARARHLVVLLLLALTAAVAVVNLGMLEDYQVDRLTGFLDQGSDTQRSTYNQDQSKTAIGNGGVLGRGYLNGTQTNLAFVPEQHTDFIFTAVGEELGFVGGATLLMLFALVVWRTWRTALVAGDLFGTLVCMGVVAMLAFQIFENVGMAMGIMPVTGIPLPFMSYGGSATVASFAMIGLVGNVHMRRFS